MAKILKGMGGVNQLRVGHTTSKTFGVKEALERAANRKDDFWARGYNGKQALHFGAGAMGKAFSNFTYWGAYSRHLPIRTYFVDVRKDASGRPVRAVEDINRQGGYTVITKFGEMKATDVLSNARALYADEQKEIDSVAVDPRTIIISTTVSPNILKTGPDGSVSPPISSITHALRARYHALGDRGQINVLVCENVFDNGSQAKDAVLTHARKAKDNGFLDWLETHVGFPNSVVDRIAPAPDALDLELGGPSLREQLTDELGYTDSQLTVVQDFMSWKLEDWDDPAKSIVLPPSQLMGPMVIVDDIKLHEKQKLLVFNGSHVICAAVGFLKGKRMTYEAMADGTTYSLVSGALSEVTNLLFDQMGFFPTSEKQGLMIKTKERLADKSIIDTLTRVLRDPFRKLSANDRLLRSARLAADLKQPHEHLAFGIAALMVCARGDREGFQFTESGVNRDYQELLLSGDRESIDWLVLNSDLMGLDWQNPRHRQLARKIADYYFGMLENGVERTAESLLEGGFR